MEIGGTRSRTILPIIALLFVAPVFGEVLSTATAPLDLLLPWNLVLMVGMYGCGAVLVREATLRWGLGWPGLVLLGATYAVFEEGLVDKFWYDPGYWADTGIGDYSVVWHTNLLLASHLTIFHTAVSMIGTIVVVERLFPENRADTWVGRIGGSVCGLSMLAVLIVYGEEFYLPPASVLVAAAGLCVVLVAAAFWTGGRVRRTVPHARGDDATTTSSAHASVGLIAFLCTALHFVSVYAIPSAGLAWPLGLLATLAPVVLGVGLIRWKTAGELAGQDALRVVTGIVSFFLILNIVYGLGGRYDMTVVGIGIGVLLWRLQRGPKSATTSA